MRTRRPFALMLLVAALLLYALTGVALARTELYLPLITKSHAPAGTIPPRTPSLENASDPAPPPEISPTRAITPLTE
ncbi:MAG TPA: hypothetical protein VNK95_13025 [Caldilineaceae bacterium]|nr:hypothetical protein [Caldilineaceae bacterium]